MVSEIVKVVVFTPVKSAKKVRDAIGEAGGGKIGNYDYCSFSIRGIGRFRPLAGSRPTIGKPDELTEVTEERIEFVCEREKLEGVIKAIGEVHPYEEVPVDVYAIEFL